MVKFATTLALILSSLASSSAFVAPRYVNSPVTQLSEQAAHNEEPTSNNNVDKFTVALTTAAVTAAPLASFAATQDDDYVYGAVAAPGGLGLAAGLGVLAIITAAVPVLLSPGEEAFNEMRDRDEGKWRK